uniref:Uncharacterized protein n=1 Tax=Caenorhabditis tropicalis TaxID=1561998 RepID=A0A1I7T2Y4_9PELO
MMIFKQSLITCSLLLILFQTNLFVASEDQHNPKCVPRPPNPSEDRPTHFLFFVDTLLDKEVLSRLQYLFKAISCEIPAVEEIKSIVMRYTNQQQVPGEALRSDKIVPEFYRDVTMGQSDKSTPCERFSRAIGRAPPTFLEHESVHFIVPIVESSTNPGCFVKAFQKQFGDHPKKDSFFFDGILINEPRNEWDKYRGTKLAIPDIKVAVNLSISDISASEKPSISHETVRLIMEYDKLIDDILHGVIERDWEDPTTTTVISTSSKPTTNRSTVATVTTTVVSTEGQKTSTDSGEILIPFLSRNSTSSSSHPPSTSTSSESTSSDSPTTKILIPLEFENEAEKFLFGDEPPNANKSTETPPEFLSKRAKPRAIATSSEVSKTTNYEEETSTLDRDYGILEEENGHLDMASGGKEGKESRDEHGFRVVYKDFNVDRAPKSFDANNLIYVLLLLLLIWLFCIFMCLIWMFRCAKNKKHKLEGEAEEQRQQLLVPFLNGSFNKPEPSAPPKVSSESEEVDDDWKNIKPAAYTASTVSQNTTKSEAESVKQPPTNAQYAPVEVSEFEDPIDDDIYNRPRGYDLTAKKAAPLRFD